MKELVIISGKGGTGKTSVVAAFAALGAATSLAFGMLLHPWAWLVLRMVNGLLRGRS